MTDQSLDTPVQRSSTARTVALIASVGIIVGAIAPWWTTFIVDIAGTRGDGKITLVLGAAAGLLVLTQKAGSGWVILAAALGVVCAGVGIYDLAQIHDAHQTLFGQDVQLVSVGWGLWLTVAASVIFAASTISIGAER